MRNLSKSEFMIKTRTNICQAQKKIYLIKRENKFSFPIDKSLFLF